MKPYAIAIALLVASALLVGLVALKAPAAEQAYDLLILCAAMVCSAAGLGAAWWTYRKEKR